ncbi:MULTISPECIES: CPBP family intramembrane glutamic endopeptidase [unclassified Bacillus (in: firmicutes)]|uniref:CPBP family intramembrane glutamic endopeptidase n=1 Tax=unclassified Bacillus (in: firmicutes) TaxID=185979 RepID=UPI0008E57043|nr:MULTISPECIES: type II CAAX endopeptidase family protein [unclassified Bacillus (in: firmicutes)]SFB26265.1 hypothetical protein SAMN02799634_11619 [Bacillus sp. UNCCL13]SFQ91938.1 hypothetical protein SAMN04488577_0217 [Bacillus sp. cl95]
MKKEYWIILIIYIGMQFSSLVGVPLFSFAGTLLGQDGKNAEILSVAYWLVFSFSVTLILVLFLLRKEMSESRFNRSTDQSMGSNIGWGLAGIFLAMASQSIAASIENMLGVEMGSKNTQQIIHIIETLPIVMLVSSIIGPILEEIVFRKIIFGSLYKKYNFFISALISSVIFALAHFEPEHILLYSAMGFTFAFLYVRTKNILVPIFAHVAMNTIVVLIQSIYKEDIERLIKETESIQNFIGGF